MRIKMLTTVLLAGFLSLTVNAGFDQFNDPIGSVSVFDIDTEEYLYGISPFGLADLQAITTNDRTYELIPNVNLYADNPGDPEWRDNAGAGPDGNRILEQNLLFEISPLTEDIDEIFFDFTVDAFDLDMDRYELKGFVKVLDPLAGYNPSTGDEVLIDGTGPQHIEVGVGGLAGQLLQVGWVIRGVNANPADTNWGSATVTATSLYAVSLDDTAPTPNPITFAIAPAAVSDSQIIMTASTAIDNYYSVEYLFTNTVNNTSSGWQSSTNYAESGLNNSTIYSYKVKARDTGGNANETGWSAAASATTTSQDTTKPEPATMSFASTDVGVSMVKLTAVTATDAAGVQYYFDYTGSDTNITDSGWQDSPIYYATGLASGTEYSYTVIARDNAAALNSNNVSAVENLTTATAEAGAFDNALTGFTGDTDSDDVLFQLNQIGLETGNTMATAIVEFDGNGATFGAGQGYTGRDQLRTVAVDYADFSIVAYATITVSDQHDLTSFLGIGQGVSTGVNNNWGVPSLQLAGVNDVLAQMRSNSNYDQPNCQLFKFVNGHAWPDPDGGDMLLSDPVGSTETFRARLTYDTVAQEVTVDVDRNYTGGTFTADQAMGTFSTLVTNDAVVTSMFEGAPVRVYTGGGEGTIVKDFEIVVTRYPVTEFDVQGPELVAGGVGIFAWEGVSGHTYDVQYSTNLVTGPWMTDPSPGASDIFSTGGAMSATSTVDGVSVFYRIIAQ